MNVNLVTLSQKERCEILNEYKIKKNNTKLSILIHKYFKNHVHCKKCNKQIPKEIAGSFWINKRINPFCSCLNQDNVLDFYKENNLDATMLDLWKHCKLESN